MMVGDGWVFLGQPNLVYREERRWTQINADKIIIIVGFPCVKPTYSLSTNILVRQCKIILRSCKIIAEKIYNPYLLYSKINKL